MKAQSAETVVPCRPRDGHDHYRIQHALTVDPSSPHVVWVGIEYKGIYKSVDGGATWTRADTGITGYGIESDPSDRCIQEVGTILVDPTDSQRVLMARLDSPGTLAMPISEHGGVWETRDGGASWRQLLQGDMNASGSKALAFGAGNPSVILHGVNNMKASWTGAPDRLYNTVGILYRTHDAGGAWRELPTGAPEGLRATGVFVDPADGQHLWLVTMVQRADESFHQEDQWTYLESTDGGETWVRGQDRLPPDYRAPADAAVSPHVFANRFLSTMTTSGPQRSFATTDGGRTWRASSEYMLVARYNPHDRTGRQMVGYAPYAANRQLWKSEDAGVTWSRLGELPAEVNNATHYGVQVSEIVWDPTESKRLYMAGSGGYVWRSEDGGAHWRTILSLEQIGGPR